MDLAELVDDFLVAAYSPEQWPQTLDRIAQAAGADGASIVFGGTTPETVAVSTSIAEPVRKYFETRAVDDPREDRVTPTLEGGFLSDLDVFTLDEIARDPFYQEFPKPLGFGWHGAALLAGEPVPVVLSLKRSLQRGPFDRRELDRLGAVLPHFRSAAHAAAVMHAASLKAQFDLMAALGLCAAVLDRVGRVLADGDSVPLGGLLAVANGRLRAPHRADQPALEAAIEGAARPERFSSKPPPQPVALRRDSGLPIVARVVPLVGTPRLSFSIAAALVVAVDMARPQRVDAVDLRAIFPLTAKEAELASRLATGEKLEQAAAALSISPGHARQRLKAIFQKTDTHRQSELVALLSRLRRPG